MNITTNDIILENAKSCIDTNTRIPNELGLALFDQETDAVAELADYMRQKMVSDTVYYTSTLFIHPTNLCELSCPMCSFYAKPGWEKAWFMTPDEVLESVKHHIDASNINEIHFVGGLWKDTNLDYYEECFTRIKELEPKLHIKALSAIEYDYLGRLHNIPVEEVFEKMVTFGMETFPGGGSEILVESIRKKVAPQKIDTDRYLEIHEIAHKLNIKSNITMLYNHIESNQHIIQHLDRVRRCQDKTGGFQTFVPLKFHKENNALGKRSNRFEEKDSKKVFAISRLMLDNVRNIKVLWNYEGVQNAIDILSGGGNDLGSTATSEKIIRLAGGITVNMNEMDLANLIRKSGKNPLKIHSGYEYPNI